MTTKILVVAVLGFIVALALFAWAIGGTESDYDERE